MAFIKFYLLIIIMCFAVACKNSTSISLPSAPVSTDNSGATNGTDGGGAGGAGAGAGAGTGTPWWDALTSYNNNVTFHISPDPDDGADPAAANTIHSSSYLHEYAANKIVLLDAGAWPNVHMRFITVNSDNTLTVDGVNTLPSDSGIGTGGVEESGSNIVHFQSSNKIISTDLFAPIGGTDTRNITLMSYNPTNQAVSIDSFYPEIETSIIALNSDDTRLIALVKDTPVQGDITWKVFNSTDLASGPLATGTFNFSSALPGPLYNNIQLWGIDDAQLVRMRGEEFIFAMVPSAEDQLAERNFENVVLTHLKLNPDNTLTVGNITSDLMDDADFGGILQYVDQTFLKTEDLVYVRKINDDYFALTGQFSMGKSFFGGNWSTDFEEPFIMLGKLNTNGSFTLGTPIIVQQDTGGEYTNFWVYPENNEILMTFESDYGEDHYFARNWAGAMPLTNYVLPGYSEDDISGETFFVANAAALPLDPVADWKHNKIHTTMDTGLMYAWNLDTSSWQQINQVTVDMLNNDNIGFDLEIRSSWGSPLWVLTYDTATLSFTRKKMAANLNETADYRIPAPMLDDLWEFVGVKLADGRIVANFSSSGKMEDTTTDESHLLVISK